jgi:hypothetical protein
MMPTIAILTDFGLRDYYVSAMKAVIISICPKVRIVDICHNVEKFNVREGAFILASVSNYFPKGTIFLAVVDPGVGTKRRAIVIESERAYYVGPDNGLLLLASLRDGIKAVYEITNKNLMLPRISRTFHGRDIFAPVAAYLALGIEPAEVGPRINDYLVPTFAVSSMKKGMIKGEILHVNGFGNIVTNISTVDLEKAGIKEGMQIRLAVGRKKLDVKICKAYGEVPRGEFLAIIGSTDNLEISINQGNAAKFLGVKAGDNVLVSSATK